MVRKSGLAALALGALLLLSACDSFIPSPPSASSRVASPTEVESRVSPVTQDPAQVAARLRSDLETMPEDYDASLRETLGPANPMISNRDELQKALDLEKDAESTFNLLRTELDTRDEAKSDEMARLFGVIDGQLAGAVAGNDVPASATIEANADKILALLDELMPAQ